MANTPHYNFNLPTEGGDDDNWGGLLNSNWTDTDTILKDLADRVAANEAAILLAQIQVGDLYLSADATDPAAKLGYGTWEAYGAGRALVGVGTADGEAWTAGETKGEADVTLTESQIPSHDHRVDPPSQSFTTNSTGSHKHSFNERVWFNDTTGGDGIDLNGSSDGTRSTSSNYMNNAGSHSHSVTVNISAFDSGNTGGGSSHTNIQPSIGVYVWRRTA